MTAADGAPLPPGGPPPASEHTGEPAHPDTLRRTFLHGLAWTAAMRWAGQLFSWISTLIVARILSPEDFGLVSMASIYIGVVSLVSEFGVGSAIVTLRDMSEDDEAQLNTAAVILGVGAFAASCAAAVPLGRIFHAPELPWVVVVMSLDFIISAFGSVPRALLLRQLSYKRVALIAGGQSLFLAGAMVIFAMMGLRYWTLVLGSLLSAALTTGLTLTQCRRRFAWPKLAGLMPAITFSRQILFARLAWYAYSNADFFVAGRRLGKELLGAYSLAWTLASVPIERISVLIANVTPAYFSALQRDFEGLRRNLLQLTEGISLLTVPLSIGIALVADDFVPVVLGPKWVPMIGPLQILAAYATIRSVSPLIPQILMVTGEARYNMWNNIFAAIVLPIGFYVGSHWGIVGIAATWIALHPLVLLLPYHRAFRRIGLPVRSYLMALWPAGNAALHMAAAVLVARWLLPSALSQLVHLITLVLIGAVVYISALWIYHRGRVVGFIRAARSASGGRS